MDRTLSFHLWGYQYQVEAMFGVQAGWRCRARIPLRRLSEGLGLVSTRVGFSAVIIIWEFPR